MKCPKCGGDGLVTDSRPSKKYIRRRRKCTSCDHRWTTVEIETDIEVGSIIDEIRAVRDVLDKQTETPDSVWKRFRLIESELVRLHDTYRYFNHVYRGPRP